MIRPRTMLGLTPHRDQAAQSIAFLASDRTPGIMGGTTLNVTCGLVPGP